ncbi:Helix-turn-helix domain protein [compost metagenome]
MSIKLLRIGEVAGLLGITVARAYELARLQMIPTVRIGRQVRVKDQSLRQWIDAGGTTSLVSHNREKTVSRPGKR